jgi:hypothetical protein
MVEAGVTSPEDIDKAMMLGYGHPVGPLRLADLVGLDAQLHAAKYLHEALGSETFRPPELLEQRESLAKNPEWAFTLGMRMAVLKMVRRRRIRQRTVRWRTVSRMKTEWPA